MTAGRHCQITLLAQTIYCTAEYVPQARSVTIYGTPHSVTSNIVNLLENKYL